MEISVLTGYLIAVVVGFLLGIFVRKRKSDGVLKVDVSDPLKDRYLMEFHIPLESIPSRKQVLLKVVSTVENP